MTDVTRFISWDVGRTFAAGDGAVVAVLANISGLAVIER